MASLVIPTSLAAGVPFEQATSARLIRATKTQRIRLAADLTDVTPFRGVFMWALDRARRCRRRCSILRDDRPGSLGDQAAVAIAELSRQAENNQQQHALDGAGRGIRQILVHR